MDDSASSRHPLRLAGLYHAALVAIIDCAIKNERHRFESGVRVRFTHCAVADLETVIHQHDERIVEDEILRRHDRGCKVSGTNESGREWRNSDDTTDTTLQSHADLSRS